MPSHHVLLFGDQAVEKLPSIRNLVLLSKSSPSVCRFLREAADVIHSELALATLNERSVFSGFNDLLGLAELHAAQKHPDEAVGAALITTERLGELILYAENDPTILTPSESRVHQLGLCTGMLPASVAAVSRDTSEIFKYGLEIIAISFRLLLEVKRRSRCIEDTPNSWGCTLIGPSTDQVSRVLDAFNVQNKIPLQRHAYMGVTSHTWTTIFGPPSVLELLWSQSGSPSGELEKVPRLKSPAAVSVHAQHLPAVDASRIIGDSPLLDTLLPSKTFMISSSTCKPFEADTMRELLFLIVADIAGHTLQMEGTLRGLISNIGDNAEVSLSVVGPTPHTPLVQKALQNAGCTVNILDAIKPSPVPGSMRGGSGSIAVVGMAGRFPGSDNLDDFWDILQAGADLHQQIPASRFNLEDFYSATGDLKNSISTKFGCFIKDPGLFDNRLFNISPREALQMDPLQRLLLMTTYEALEMAGYAPNAWISTHESRIATYFGQTTDDWRIINDQQGTDIHYVPGCIRAFAPGRLNHHFKWGGGYYNIDAACSSSLTSIQLAYSALLDRQCDAAVVGGGNIMLVPELYSGLSKGGFLSSTGACKTFSIQADGYCRGEAVGVVVLKRLEDAVRDNDTIQAVIRGAARNFNTNAPSITQPDVVSQETLFKKILQQSSVDPHDVGYIEMHGTGTQVGDPIEMDSVTRVFANGRSQDNPLYLGSIKANIGHGEAASGVVSLIKVILMLKYDSIPPQPGFPFELNHKFPSLERLNVQIADGKSTLGRWYKGDGKRKLVVNNFDAAGGNTSVLVEEAPVRESNSQDSRGYYVVVCSAATPYSLKENKRRLRDYLLYNRDINIADLAYTTTARRIHPLYRDAFVVQSTDEVVKKLDAHINKDEPSSKPSISPASVIFNFTGQGSQYAGMGRTLLHTCPRFRGMLESYQELCDLHGLPSFIELIRDPDVDIGSKSTVQVQLAIVALEIALAKLWLSWGVKPNLVIGHSLGEYAALCISGVLSVSDAIYLVGKRALLIQENCTAGSHAMLATSLSEESAQSALNEGDEKSCQIACMNSPTMTVISGKSGEIRSLQDRLAASRIKTTLLEVPYGFHSSQIDPILRDYEEIASGIHFAKPALPIASTLTGTVVKDSDTFSPAYLVQQARCPVDFVGAMRNCHAGGLINEQSLFIEIGPQPICLGLVCSCLSVKNSRLFPSLKAGEDDWKVICTSVASVYVTTGLVNWPEFHRDYTTSLNLLDLPPYAFDVTDYWIPYTRLAPAIPLAEAPTAQALASALSTTCLQRVKTATFDQKKIHVTFTSNTSESNLYKAIQGHFVDGVALCPASIFIDMAYTAAKYILTETQPGKPLPPMALTHLEIKRALTVSKINIDQTISVTATMSGGDSSIHIAYSSSNGSSSEDHGECRIELGDQSFVWKSHWEKSQILIKRRVDNLIKSSASGSALRLTRSLVYKLFSSRVVYGNEYQGLEQVFLDDFSDAAAHIKLQPALGLGSFTQNPYWIDAIVHLAGFILNGNFANPNEEIHISNGLQSMHIISDLSDEQQYNCYACIRPGNGKGVSLCDVYIYFEDQLVAVTTGIRFQKMTKAVFSTIISKTAAGEEVHRKISSQVTTTASVPSLQKAPMVAHSEATLQSSLDNSTGVFTLATKDSSHTSEATPSLSSILLDAVALQLGITTEEIESSTSFAELGVDSFMSVAIISDFKKMTGIELPAAFFNTFPQVWEAQKELGSGSQAEPLSAPEVLAMPSMADSVSRQEVVRPVSKTKGVADQFLRIVSIESGIDLEDLKSTSEFSALGVDSFLSVSIISAFSKDTGIELPAAFFDSFPTVSAVREELDGLQSTADIPQQTSPLPVEFRPGSGAAAPPQNIMPLVGLTTPAPLVNVESLPKQDACSQQSQSCRPMASAYQPKIKTRKLAANITPRREIWTPYSRVILIQGRPNSTETPLFLITDGSGSVTSYIHFSPLPNGRRIYALESPFLARPEEFPKSISEVADLYLAAIRKAQPEGPYLIGGWSAGGVYAYEVSRKLLISNERILGLLIMDMRVPHAIPDAVEPTFELMEQTGLMVGAYSQTQVTHLLMTFRALIDFEPVPMAINLRPDRTFIVWATLGLDEDPGDRENEDNVIAFSSASLTGSDPAKTATEDLRSGIRNWFYGKRYDFGPNGWEHLVGDKIECHKIEANHVSMVAKPMVKELSKLVLQAIETFTLGKF